MDTDGVCDVEYPDEFKFEVKCVKVSTTSRRSRQGSVTPQGPHERAERAHKPCTMLAQICTNPCVIMLLGILIFCSFLSHHHQSHCTNWQKGIRYLQPNPNHLSPILVRYINYRAICLYLPHLLCVSDLRIYKPSLRLLILRPKSKSTLGLSIKVSVK